MKTVAGTFTVWALGVLTGGVAVAYCHVMSDWAVCVLLLSTLALAVLVSFVAWKRYY